MGYFWRLRATHREKRISASLRAERSAGKRERDNVGSPQPSLQLSVHVFVKWSCGIVTTPIVVVTVTVCKKIPRQNWEGSVTFFCMGLDP